MSCRGRRATSRGRRTRFRKTYDRTQGKLLQIENDGITAIVTGRKPVSYWKTVLKQWKHAGGDASAREFAKEHAAQH